MRGRSKSGSRTLRELAVLAAASSLDPVDHWKSVVRARLASRSTEPGSRRLGVRVTPGFALLAATIGLPRGLPGAIATLVVVSSVFLLHEVSRALVACVLGRASRVVITARGCDTHLEGAELTGKGAFAFLTAGSHANLAFALLLGLVRRGVAPGLASSVLSVLVFSHAAWGAIQLVPLIPFRAGRALGAQLRPSRRFAHAAASVAILVAVLAVVAARHQAAFALGLLLLVTTSAVLLREAYRESCDERLDVTDTIAKARVFLSEGDVEKALESCERGLDVATSLRARARLQETLAWAAIGLENPFLAHAALLGLPPERIDEHLLAAYLACCNRIDEAISVLEEARASGQRRPETTKLLIDLLFRRGESAGSAAIAAADAALLSPGEREAVEIAFRGSAGCSHTNSRNVVASR